MADKNDKKPGLDPDPKKPAEAQPAPTPPVGTRAEDPPPAESKPDADGSDSPPGDPPPLSDVDLIQQATQEEILADVATGADYRAAVAIGRVKPRPNPDNLPEVHEHWAFRDAEADTYGYF